MPDDFQTPSDPPVRSTECSATRPLMVTEEENNYLWHLADNHKMTTVGDEPDAQVLCVLLQKLGELRETQWPNDQGEARHK